MFTFLVILHIPLAALLIAVVLMQSGKGGGLAGAFGGGGGNQTVFGGRGAVDFLGKATWILGSAFMLNSLLLAMAAGGGRGGDSLIEKSTFPAPISAPAVPGDVGSGGIPGTVPGTGTGDVTPSDAGSPAAGDPAVAPAGTEAPPSAPPAGGGQDTPDPGGN